MSISFVQQYKKLYAAGFTVFHNDAVIGTLSMKGRLGSREGQWNGTVMGRQISMKRCSGVPGFRPYEISVDGRLAGSVSQIDVKTGLLSGHQYHQLQLEGRSYQLYAVGLGKQGGVCSLYCDGSQLAEIDTEATVYNELFRFETFAVDTDSAFVSILLCCYMYMLGCYRPGEAVSSSVRTRVTVTTNKDLLAKYDPNFKAMNKTL